MKKHATDPDLLKALELESLSPEEQEELLLDLNELVYKGSLMRLVGMMDEKTKADFEKLLDSGASEDDVERFLAARVPDSGRAVEDTIQELRDDILAVTGASQD